MGRMQSASPAGAAGARKSGAGGARKGRRTYHHGARQRPPARRSAETVRGASVGAVATAVLGREAAVVVGRSVTEASASAPAWGKAREVVTHHRLCIRNDGRQQQLSPAQTHRKTQFKCIARVTRLSRATRKK